MEIYKKKRKKENLDLTTFFTKNFPTNSTMMTTGGKRKGNLEEGQGEKWGEEKRRFKGREKEGKKPDIPYKKRHVCLEANGPK